MWWLNVPCIRGWEVITHLVWLEVVILCCAKCQSDYCYYSEIILVHGAALNSLEVHTHTHTDEINCHQLIITLLLCLKKQNEVEVTHQQWARVCENSLWVCAWRYGWASETGPSRDQCSHSVFHSVCISAKHAHLIDICFKYYDSTWFWFLW